MHFHKRHNIIIMCDQIKSSFENPGKITRFLIYHASFPGVSKCGHYTIAYFGNHSDNPNCEKRKHKVFHLPSDRWNLFTSRDIEVGEELTWRYTLYEINDENA